MSQQVYPGLPGLAWSSTRSPLWKTGRTETTSGREFRVRYQTSPRYHYKLSYDVLRETGSLVELQTIMGFFNLMGGSFDTFLFNDADDNTATAQQFGVGNASATEFQLVRARGGFAEPVYDLNAAPSIYVAGVLKIAGAHYTVSAVGVVTFLTAPAASAALTWTGTYYWRCAFVNDTTEFTQFMKQLWEAKTVEFRTQKP